MYRKTVTIFLLVMFLFAGIAYAGVWGDIKAKITGEVLAWLLGGFAAILTVGVGVLKNKVKNFDKIMETIGEVGDLLESLSNASADGKITKEEIDDIIAKINAIRT